MHTLIRQMRLCRRCSAEGAVTSSRGGGGGRTACKSCGEGGGAVENKRTLCGEGRTAQSTPHRESPFLVCVPCLWQLAAAHPGGDTRVERADSNRENVGEASGQHDRQRSLIR